MSSTLHNQQHKMRATRAAAFTNCTAVVLTELPAAFASFQRPTVHLPPTQNVDSARVSLFTALQFSRNHEIYDRAANAVTTATFATF